MSNTTKSEGPAVTTNTINGEMNEHALRKRYSVLKEEYENWQGCRMNVGRNQSASSLPLNSRLYSSLV
jgi:hypothetical protein